MVESGGPYTSCVIDLQIRCCTCMNGKIGERNAGTMAEQQNMRNRGESDTEWRQKWNLCV